MSTHHKRRPMILGQIAALLTAGTGAAASSLARRGVNSPTLQNMPSYLLLGSLILMKREKRRDVKWYQWLLLALIDVEANCLAVWAYSRTSLTSAMLLDSFSIPCVMLLSIVFLKAQYSSEHLFGAATCFAGILLTVASDALPKSSGGRGDGWFCGNAVLGDLMAVGAATLYACSNVAQEFFLKSHGSPTAVLARLGVAGFSICFIQESFLIFFATDFSLRTTNPFSSWSSLTLLAYVGYALSLAGIYLVASLVLSEADATALNLSLLMADAYAVVFAWLVANDPPPPLYFLAAACTIAGVLRYNLAISNRPTSTLFTPLSPQHLPYTTNDQVNSQLPTASLSPTSPPPPKQHRLLLRPSRSVSVGGDEDEQLDLSEAHADMISSAGRNDSVFGEGVTATRQEYPPTRYLLS